MRDGRIPVLSAPVRLAADTRGADEIPRVLIVQPGSDAIATALRNLDVFLETAEELPSSPTAADVCVAEAQACGVARLAPYLRSGARLVLVASSDVPEWRLAELTEAGCSSVLVQPSARMLQAQVRGLLEARSAAMRVDRQLRVDTPMLGLMTSDSNGKILDANDTLLKMLGVSREAVAAGELNWRDLTPEEWHACSEKAVEQVNEHGKATPFEKEYLRPDGARVPVLVTATRGEHNRIFSAVIEIQSPVQARDRLSLLSEATALLTASLDQHQALERFASLVVPRLSDWCAIDVLAPEGDLERLIVAGARGNEQERAAAHPRSIALEHSTVGRVLRTGEVQWEEQPSQEYLERLTRGSRELTSMRSVGITSHAVIPLKARNRIFGCLSLIHAKSKRVFRRHDIGFLEELASGAAVLLERASLEQQTQRASLGAQLIAEIGQRLTRDAALEHGLWECARAVVMAFGLAHVRIWSRDPERDQLRLRASVGVHCSLDEEHRIVDLGAGSVGAAAESGTPMIRNGGEEPDASWSQHPGVEAIAAFPMRIRDQVIGVLGVFAVRRFGVDELEALQAATDFISLGLWSSDAGVRVSAKTRTLQAGAALVATPGVNATVDSGLFTNAQGLIEKLARSNRDLEQFAYIISHELKAPVRGIAHLAEFLHEDLDGCLNPEGARHLGMLSDRARRLDRLIDGVLHYSRVGRAPRIAERVNVRELVEGVVSLLSPTTPLTISLDDLWLVTEATQLEQVFMNLIENAFQHATRANAMVTVGMDCHGPEPVFFVRDRGPGIPEEMIDRIWGIFRTVPGAPTAGMGIGLAIVRKLVERRRGRAWVESDGATGSTFCFTWPPHSGSV